MQRNPVKRKLALTTLLTQIAYRTSIRMSVGCVLCMERTLSLIGSNSHATTGSSIPSSPNEPSRTQFLPHMEAEMLLAGFGGDMSLPRVEHIPANVKFKNGIKREMKGM
jgi:hypothetical protein